MKYHVETASDGSRSTIDNGQPGTIAADLPSVLETPTGNCSSLDIATLGEDIRCGKADHLDPMLTCDKVLEVDLARSVLLLPRPPRT